MTSSKNAWEMLGMILKGDECVKRIFNFLHEEFEAGHMKETKDFLSFSTINWNL